MSDTPVADEGEGAKRLSSQRLLVYPHYTLLLITALDSISICYTDSSDTSRKHTEQSQKPQTNTLLNLFGLLLSIKTQLASKTFFQLSSSTCNRKL